MEKPYTAVCSQQLRREMAYVAETGGRIRNGARFDAGECEQLFDRAHRHRWMYNEDHRLRYRKCHRSKVLLRIVGQAVVDSRIYRQWPIRARADRISVCRCLL